VGIREEKIWGVGSMLPVIHPSCARENTCAWGGGREKCHAAYAGFESIEIDHAAKQNGIE
jgi:hypothetical protein